MPSKSIPVRLPEALARSLRAEAVVHRCYVGDVIRARLSRGGKKLTAAEITAAKLLANGGTVYGASEKPRKSQGK